MAENTSDATNGAGQAAPVMPKMQILGQFVRDLSFENVAAQKAVQGATQPDVQVRVGLDARKRPTENQYDVIVKLNVDAKTKGDTPEPIFLIELDYAGIFHIENVPDTQIQPFLMIECPRMLFPFIRRIVSDVTRDGGYLPLNLETIDFVSIYRNEVAKQMANRKPDA